jgi:hypothetical protein
MLGLDRRAFLGASLGGVAALAGGASLFSKDAPNASQSNTLFLTWQRDPTTTMTVQWVGKSQPTSETAIHYVVDGQSGWQTIATQQRPYPSEGLHVFRAELTGLTPGTEYRFRIGQDTAAKRFRTMPAKATDSFHFVSGGDCGANEHVIANNILAAKQNPMFALIGGDLAYDDGFKVDANLAFLQNYSRHMIDTDGRLIPMVVCIGNHEVRGGYNAKRSDGPLFFALHDGLYRDRTFATLDFGDYLSLVLLDTGHVAPIAGEQTSWLDKALADRVDYPHLFVVNHVPSYPSFRPPEAGNAKEGTGAASRKLWTPLFERHNVDVVLEHHDHTFKRTHFLRDGTVNANGILYLGDGSWGKLRSLKKVEPRPYLAATNESYHFTLHRLEGDERTHVAMEETGKTIDICHTTKRPRRKVGRS